MTSCKVYASIDTTIKKLPRSFAGYFQEVVKTHRHNTRAANTLNYVLMPTFCKVSSYEYNCLNATLSNDQQLS